MLLGGGAQAQPQKGRSGEETKFVIVGRVGEHGERSGEEVVRAAATRQHHRFGASGSREGRSGVG